MCNWIGSLFVSALLWGFQDSICDIIIATKPELVALTNGEAKKVKTNEETSYSMGLNANQLVFICMIAAFVMV